MDYRKSAKPLAPSPLLLFHCLATQDVDLWGAAKLRGVSISTANQQMRAAKDYYFANTKYYVLWRLVKENYISTVITNDTKFTPHPHLFYLSAMATRDLTINEIAAYYSVSMASINTTLGEIRSYYLAENTTHAIYNAIRCGHISLCDYQQYPPCKKLSAVATPVLKPIRREYTIIRRRLYKPKEG